MVGLAFIRGSNVSGDGCSCCILHARRRDRQEMGLSGHPDVLQLGSGKRRGDGRLAVGDQGRTADGSCSGLLEASVLLRHSDALQRPARTALRHEEAVGERSDNRVFRQEDRMHSG